MLILYRSLIALRRRMPALAGGAYRAVPLGENILAYERVEGNQRLLIALNLDSDAKPVRLTSWAGTDVLLSTRTVQPASVSMTLVLHPDEGVVIPQARDGELAQVRAQLGALGEHAHQVDPHRRHISFQ